MQGNSETFRCKCIKLYVDDVFFDRDLFPIGKWYTAYESRSYYVVKYGDGDNDTWAISKERFKEHFITIDVVREIEIDKILEI